MIKQRVKSKLAHTNIEKWIPENNSKLDKVALECERKGMSYGEWQRQRLANLYRVDRKRGSNNE